MCTLRVCLAPSTGIAPIGICTSKSNFRGDDVGVRDNNLATVRHMHQELVSHVFVESLVVYVTIPITVPEEVLAHQNRRLACLISRGA